jgi:hypothetical protein
MSEATSYESIDQAARELRLGARRAEFTAAGRQERGPVVTLVPPLIVFGLVAWLLGVAGLLTSFIGTAFVVVFAVLIGRAAARMTSTADEGRGDQALHVFEEGVVIRGAKGRILPYRWEQARLVRVGVRPAGSSDGRARWSYGLLSTTTPPVVMGRTVATGAMLTNSEGVDLGNISRAAEFERIDVWGPALEAGITRATTPRVLDDLAAGRTVAFGPVSAKPEGLAIGRKVTPWSEVTNLRIDDGYLQWKQRGRLFRSSVLANDVPNFLVLVSVADRLAAAALE